MKWIFLFFCVCIVTTNCNAIGSTQRSFMPPNELYKFDKQQRANITQDEFNSILDVVELTYKPIFQMFGANFVLERAWEDSTVNAYAEQNGNNWIVHMYGGMARRSEMNIAGFGLVACHEIGHHLGGFPFYNGNEWASNEGNSDYFANFVCAKKVFKNLPVPTLPESTKSKCDAIWVEQADRDACYKSLDGGQALGNLLAALANDPNPSYDTPDSSIVAKTSDSHPRAQCRLDTYLAGAICAKTYNDAIIPKDEFIFCTTRPRCWFAPSDTPPNPTPNPPPNPPPPGPTDGDAYTANLINNYRAKSHLDPLEIYQPYVCAATNHVKDIAPAGRCSHQGTNGSQFHQRLKACGFNGPANEIIACRFKDREEALRAWTRDHANRQVILKRRYTHVGCAVELNYVVCILGM